MFLPLLLAAIFFLVGLIVRRFFFENLCALCLSVSLAWIYLLCAYLIYGVGNTLIIGILLGGSAVGGLYYFFSLIPQRYHIFKLPYLLSSFWAIYFVLNNFSFVLEEVLFLVLLWIVFFVIFIFYTNKKFRVVGQRIIECCRNW